VAVGHAPAIPRGAKAAAAPAGSTKLTIDVALNTPNSGSLAAFARSVNDPSSASYHQFLAKGQVARQFGASAAEVASVDAALKNAGLTPGPVSADGLFIPITATVDQAKSAFGTDFAGYRVGSRTVYANTAAPKVDATIASDVAGIVGLDDIAHATPKYVRTGHIAKVAAAARPHASVGPRFSTPTCSNINKVLNVSGLQNGRDYYTSDALSNIYGISSLRAGGNTGVGITVAVFELENFDPTGVTNLEACYGSGAAVSEVAVDGGPTVPANLATGVGIESALDIENIADLAPNVSIIDYAGPDAINANDTQVLDTYGKIITDDTAKVISTSWGLCEAESASATISSESTLFAEAAAQGQTVIAAAGDAGSTDCFPVDNSSALGVDDPASQPNVLAAGGTSMTGLSGPPMSTWNSVQTDGMGHQFFGATGGGVSSAEALPAYQSAVTASGYSAHCTAPSGCRQVPDVSALADPNQGYVIDELFDDGTGNPGLSYAIIGGTSGAAPVWAAIYALADASTGCKTNGAAGQAAPALYAVGQTPSRFSVFRDVSTGDNGISAFHAPFGYPATAGYDMATGWGTPLAPGVVSTACKSPLASAASFLHPVGPVRILDTRKGTVGITGPIAPGAHVKLQISGQHGVAASNVTAAVLNVTVTGTTGSGFATVYPDGGAVPLTSNLNWSVGETVPNLVVVPVGADGAVDLLNGSGGNVQFVADLSGYFTSDSAASGISTYTPVGPVRALDTRKGVGAPAAKIGANTSLSLLVGGTTISGVSIPSGITAVAVNVTVTGPAAGGFLTVYPDGTTRPLASNLNFSAGETVPNMVIVPVGADGKVDLFNGSGGTTDAVADIAGYFAAGTNGSKYHSVGPDRILDTRIALGENGAAPIPAVGTIGVPIPSAATAAVLNLTVTQPKAGGFLTAFPDGSTRPLASNLNFGAGETVPNLAIVGSNGQVDFFNGASGTTHLIADLSGYFSAS
jgi:subtilase family serine protease